MKQLLFFLLISLNSIGQEYHIKVFNSAAANRPLYQQLKKGKEPGTFIITDSLLWAEFECYMELLSSAYYTDSSKKSAIASIDKLRDDIIVVDEKYDHYVITPLTYYYYFGKSLEEIKLEAVRVRLVIPGFSYATIGFNYENGKRTIECNLANRKFGAGRYNLTTGTSEPTNAGVIGQPELWDLFIASNGLKSIVDQLARLAEGI